MSVLVAVMVVLSTLSVKVIDFGLAKQLDNASLISRMYTPMYFRYTTSLTPHTLLA
jgi:hypothetical protein